MLQFLKKTDESTVGRRAYSH